MDLEMVLNELSFKTPVADIRIARQLMTELINTLSQATRSGLPRILRTHNDINSIELAADYPIARWRNDGEVRLEERSFFRTLTSKAPIWDDAPQDIKNDFDLSLVSFKGEEAIGLSFALVSDALAVSLLSDSQWDNSRLNVEVVQTDENEKFITKHAELFHASRQHHILEHFNWVQKRIQEVEITDGSELWNRREELFYNLDFCDVVEKQLQNLRAGQLELRPVIKSLFGLQMCSNSWNSGRFSLQTYSLEESGESEATLNRYSQERTFRCPDGKERLFERHIKLRFCNWRIHFFPLQHGKVIVGCIGRHLPTDKYPT